jgi:hypothetical protein
VDDSNGRWASASALDAGFGRGDNKLQPFAAGHRFEVGETSRDSTRLRQLSTNPVDRRWTGPLIGIQKAYSTPKHARSRSRKICSSGSFRNVAATWLPDLAWLEAHRVTSMRLKCFGQRTPAL